jgi:hypothetical protein
MWLAGLWITVPVQEISMQLRTFRRVPKPVCWAILLFACSDIKRHIKPSISKASALIRLSLHMPIDILVALTIFLENSCLIAWWNACWMALSSAPADISAGCGFPRSTVEINMQAPAPPSRPRYYKRESCGDIEILRIQHMPGSPSRYIYMYRIYITWTL